MRRTMALSGCLLLAACGQKGDLYLPAEQPAAVIVPAPAPAGEADPEDERPRQQPAPDRTDN